MNVIFTFLPWKKDNFFSHLKNKRNLERIKGQKLLGSEKRKNRIILTENNPKKHEERKNER